MRKLHYTCIGGCEIDFSRHTTDVFISFRCESTCCWCYPIDAIQSGLKALHIANETYLRINEVGIMCVQHQIKTAKNQDTFIDFFILPISEDGIGGTNTGIDNS